MQGKDMENQDIVKATDFNSDRFADMENQDIVKATDFNSDRFADKSKKQLLTSDLGWTAAEIKETHYRLMAFKDDWDAPGMEAYDEL